MSIKKFEVFTWQQCDNGVLVGCIGFNFENFAKIAHCADKNAEKHAPTEVIELSSSPDERHPAKSRLWNFQSKQKT